jgi:hypothetical protein
VDEIQFCQEPSTIHQAEKITSKRKSNENPAGVQLLSTRVQAGQSGHISNMAATKFILPIIILFIALILHSKLENKQDIDQVFLMQHHKD